MCAAPLLESETLAQACPWNANLTTSATSDHESESLTYSWTEVGSCPDFTFDHYQICRVKDTDISGSRATPDSTSPDCEITVVTKSVTSLPFDFVHRSQMQYGTSIFACENALCTEYWGGPGCATCSATNFRTDAYTEKERWVLEDVYSATAPYSDSDRVIDEVTGRNPSASAALMYPGGLTYGGQLGIWWSEGSTTGGTPTINYKRAEDTGWQDWNTYTGWEGETTVVEGVAGGSGSLREPTHPWVVSAGAVESAFVRLFFHTAGSIKQIWSLDSTDDVGDAFDVECGDTGGCDLDVDTCAYGDLCDLEDVSADGGEATLEICADTDDADCFYLDEAAHGRLVTNYVEDPVVEFASEEPSLLFTGQMDSTCSAYSGESDIMQAWWDAGAQAWDMDVDGSCPDGTIGEDRHDPGVIPLPEGEFKVYMQHGAGDGADDGGHIEVCYWNGTLWEDCQDVEFAFDDGSSRGVSPNSMGLGTLAEIYECVANIDAIVFIESGTVYEGAFLKAATWTTHDSDACFLNGGVLYAEHRN